MADPGAQYDPRHPHEPAVPPTFDGEGRCLVCALMVDASAGGALAERRKVIAELGSERAVKRLADVIGFYTRTGGRESCETLCRNALREVASLLAPVEDGTVMPNMRTDEPEPQARHIEEASA